MASSPTVVASSKSDLTTCFEDDFSLFSSSLADISIDIDEVSEFLESVVKNEPKEIQLKPNPVDNCINYTSGNFALSNSPLKSPFSDSGISNVEDEFAIDMPIYDNIFMGETITLES